MDSQAWVGNDLVYLRKAVLCANCDVISEGRNGHCAACGSEALLNLSRLLGGTISSSEIDVILQHSEVVSGGLMPQLGLSAAA
jgi:hypothetical protein